MIRTALKKVNIEILNRQNAIEELRNKIDKAEPVTYQDVEDIVEDWGRITDMQSGIKGLEIAKSILEGLCLNKERRVSG